MVDTSETMGAKYITPKYVKDIQPDQRIVQIDNEAQYKETKWGKKLIAKVVINGVTKEWVINPTTNLNLGNIWGVDSANWNGKRVKLEITRIGDQECLVGWPIEDEQVS